MSHIVSASQIDTFLLCERKWAWRYLEGKKTPPNRSAQCGTRVHEILEQWLSKGVPPNPNETLELDGTTYYPGLIAMSGMHTLPAPGPHLFTEREFRFRHWLGYVDLSYVSIERTPVIYDHKTTGDLVWAKAEDVLKNDVQAILYANAALEEMPDAPHVDLCWNYMQTRKPYKNKAVRLRVLSEYAREALRPFDAIAQRLIAYKDGGSRAIDLPINAKACDAYGGCPHRLDCNLTPEQIMRAKMSREKTLEEKIAEAAAQANAPRTNGAPAPLPPPLTPAAPGAVLLKAGWEVHPTSPPHAWNPATREVVAIETVLEVVAPPPPPPAAPAAPPAPPAAPAAPPVPTHIVAAAPAAPPALNAPEAPAEDRREPAPDTAPQAPDELDALDKDALKLLAAKEGVTPETMKGLREKGLKEAIRKERIIRGRGNDLPPPPAPPSGVHQVAPPPPPPLAAPPPPPAGTYDAVRPEIIPDGAAVSSLIGELHGTTLIACALISAREHHDDDMSLARRAKSIYDCVQRVCSED